ncbi:MAG: prolipoprotein diacylglyceryl transferase [Lachnospiraceae bacterium]
MADIYFPHLGIEIENLASGITIFGFEIKFYGIIIMLGMVLGVVIACRNAKLEGGSSDDILDFGLYAIVLSVIGARIYYVIFEWDNYKDDLWQIFNIRGGGLAIYGGVITAVIVCVVYTRIKKMNTLQMADWCIPGLIAGQMVGRWGNFFNCEAFGGYTDNLFAMQIKASKVHASAISQELADNMIVREGVEYIQVHPTFLYESVWNGLVLAGLLLYRKHRKCNGELLCLYFVGYGIGRFMIESLRTDQLKLWGTDIAVSQMLSLIFVVAAIICIVLIRKYLPKREQ